MKSSVTKIHKQYGVFVKSQRSRIISNLINFSLYRGLKWVSSDLETDDTSMCQCASLILIKCIYSNEHK